MLKTSDVFKSRKDMNEHVEKMKESWVGNIACSFIFGWEFSVETPIVRNTDLGQNTWIRWLVRVVKILGWCSRGQVVAEGYRKILWYCSGTVGVSYKKNQEEFC